MPAHGRVNDDVSARVQPCARITAVAVRTLAAWALGLALALGADSAAAQATTELTLAGRADQYTLAMSVRPKAK